MIGYGQQFLQGTTWSSLHWSWSLEMPTLVIAGERDRLVPPANGLLLAHRIPNSRLHRLRDEGHLMLFDPESASVPLLAEYFASRDLDTSVAWAGGEVVEDGEEVERALRATSGTPPMKALSAAYRAWVGTPVVRRVFGG
jgi:hypothetical protein